MILITLIACVEALVADPSCEDACAVLYDTDAGSCGSTATAPYAEEGGHSLASCSASCAEAEAAGTREADAGEAGWTACIMDQANAIADGSDTYGSANLDACDAAVAECGALPCQGTTDDACTLWYSAG